MVLDVVRRFAVRDLAKGSRRLFMSIALMTAVRRLEQRQPLHGRARARGGPRAGSTAAAAAEQRPRRPHPETRCGRRRPTEPEPPDVRGPVTALPSMYAMSDWPGYGATTALLTTVPPDATYRMFVSGSNEPPCQFVPPSWLGAISVPSGPSILLTTGGVNSGPILCHDATSSASPLELGREVDEIVRGHALPVVGAAASSGTAASANTIRPARRLSAPAVPRSARPACPSHDRTHRETPASSAARRL